MNEAQQTRLLAASLLVAGLTVLAVKVFAYGVPLLSPMDAQQVASLPELFAPFRDLEAEAQDTFAIILTIPLGIMLLVFLRQFVGLSTIGTFMPVLIGVSFHTTGPLLGAILFTVLVAFGLLVRLYFERLRLLLVPRLAAIVIIVVMAMIVITVMLEDAGISVGASASLFPLVILAMTIERMAVAWEELEPSEAVMKGIGSLVVAVLSFWLMSFGPLKTLMFRFPELLLVLLAITLMMGRYMGLRLSELVRFREVS